MIVAIDGPAGSGKSTVARALSQRLNLVFLDTGAMYRSVSVVCLEKGISLDDTEAIIKFRLPLEIHQRVRLFLRMDTMSLRLSGPLKLMHVFLALRPFPRFVRLWLFFRDVPARREMW